MPCRRLLNDTNDLDKVADSNPDAAVRFQSNRSSSRIEDEVVPFLFRDDLLFD